jgi:hypothetical protein
VDAAASYLNCRRSKGSIMQRLLVGTRKGLFTIDRAGSTYDVVDTFSLGVPVTAVLHDGRDDSTYAALDHGHFGTKLHRRDPGGDWAEVVVPEYPPQPEGEVDLEPFRQIPIPWATKLVWTVEAGHPDDPGALWAGTIPGGLFRSADRGESWELVRSLWDDPLRKAWTGGGYDYPGLHSICVDPRDPAALTVGVSTGGVWSSADGGASWTIGKGMRNEYMPPGQEYEPVAQDAHRLAACAADPDVIWCQHHNGIFRSVDRGATWDEIVDVEPSVFGFAVGAHPHDPDTAWFVPAQKDEMRIPVDGRMVVTRTRDGGKSFEVLSRGLPERHAYHLVYRHALDVDAEGERLAIASTTGSLWISEDAGDSWVPVTSTLPPIACVRWTA